MHMGTRLFVGNFPFDTNEDQLRAHFSAAGHTPAAVKIVTDRDSGESRGFGFVDLASEEAAKAAIAALDGKDFGGRALKVNEAQERAGAGGGRAGGAAGDAFRGGGQGFDRGAKGGFGSRGPGQNIPRGSTRGGGRGGSRGS
ncbi:MAG: hypothetical protein NVS2B9_20540 [Myxococcales bacterium]